MNHAQRRDTKARYKGELLTLRSKRLKLSCHQEGKVKSSQVKSSQVKSSQVRSSLHLPGLLPEILNHVDAHRPNQTSSEALRRHQGERTEEILDHVDAHPLAPTRRALDCASMLDGGEPRP